MNNKTVRASMDHVYGLILAGGQSSRLFPFNKVLSDLTGEGRTLLQQAADRLVEPLRKGPEALFVSPKKLYVMTAQNMVLPMSRQLRLPSSHFFVDPARRGTWPAILWAMAHIGLQDAEAVLAVTTSDHVIGDTPAFRRGVAEALIKAQEKPALVVLAVKPSANPSDWLGFGSFKMKSRGAAGRAQLIMGFEEKPSLERASAMIAEKEWQWNAGLFFIRISTAEHMLRQYQPAMYDTYAAMQMELKKGNVAKAKKRFEAFPSKIIHPLDSTREVDNSIDYALAMPLVHHPLPPFEVLGVAGALPAWTDLGRWDVLRELVRADSAGNVRVGHIKAGRSVRDCILVADQGHWIEVSGLQKCVVAFSGGVALAMPVAELSRMKEVVAQVLTQPKDRTLSLGENVCVLKAMGGRLIAYGLPAGTISLARHRLRVIMH